MRNSTAVWKSLEAADSACMDCYLENPILMSQLTFAYSWMFYFFQSCFFSFFSGISYLRGWDLGFFSSSTVYYFLGSSDFLMRVIRTRKSPSFTPNSCIDEAFVVALPLNIIFCDSISKPLIYLIFLLTDQTYIMGRMYVIFSTDFHIYFLPLQCFYYYFHPSPPITIYYVQYKNHIQIILPPSISTHFYASASSYSPLWFVHVLLYEQKKGRSGN